MRCDSSRGLSAAALHEGSPCGPLGRRQAGSDPGPSLRAGIPLVRDTKPQYVHIIYIYIIQTGKHIYNLNIYISTFIKSLIVCTQAHVLL